MDAFKAKWQLYVALAALVAIGLSLAMDAFQVARPTFPLLVIIAIGGVPVFLQILIKLLSGNLGADLLAAIALVTGVILEQYLAATLIILMLASGQSLEYYARRRASFVLRSLVARMPSIAHRKRNNQIDDIPLLDVQVDDLLVIYPHETCPADGVVVEGHGSMDESYLTGEPYQIAKTPGAFVLSGAINGETLLLIKTTKRTPDSRYSAIVKVLEEAEQKRPSLRRLGDQIGAVFAPTALIFALAAWYFSGDAIRFLSVLVIATPCPLLIAIPITIISAISRAARQAIVIKDPTVLERLPTCKTAIFDKTGTLTYGRPSLSDIALAPNFTREMLLQYAASLERYSKHPLSSAVLHTAQQEGVALLESSNVSEKAGQGLSGIINGHHLLITNRKTCLTMDPPSESLLPSVASGLECIILIDRHYAGALHFHDAPRLESKSFLGHLGPSHQFEKIMLVSGDRESEVSYLANLLNIKEVRASQSPEQKLEIVRKETKAAPTVFMGDGINDAPALTAATVGIAFGQYSTVTAEAAGAVIMENTLSKVDELLHLSLNTRKIALESALGGMLLSILGMGFAAAGYINPVSGAIIQELIDVLAILNALRLAMGSQIKIDLPPPSVS